MKKKVLILLCSAAVLALTAFCANRVRHWIDTKRENPLNDVFASLASSSADWESNADRVLMRSATWPRQQAELTADEAARLIGLVSKLRVGAEPAPPKYADFSDARWSYYSFIIETGDMELYLNVGLERISARVKALSDDPLLRELSKEGLVPYDMNISTEDDFRELLELSEELNDRYFGPSVVWVGRKTEY